MKILSLTPMMPLTDDAPGKTLMALTDDGRMWHLSLGDDFYWHPVPPLPEEREVQEIHALGEVTDDEVSGLTIVLASDGTAWGLHTGSCCDRGGDGPHWAPISEPGSPRPTLRSDLTVS